MIYYTIIAAFILGGATGATLMRAWDNTGEIANKKGRSHE